MGKSKYYLIAKKKNSSDYINLNSGIITKNAAATINPYVFTQCLFEYLSSFENVQIYENTKIEDIKCKYDEVISKTNNGFIVRSSKLIFSTGIDTLKYVKDLPIELYKTFTIVTRPLDNINCKKFDFTLKDMQEPNHYLRFSKDNRVIYSGENVRYIDRYNDERYFDMVSNDKYRKLLLSLQKMLTSADNISIEYAYNGTVAKTKDGLPIVDEIDNMPNCFCNLSFGNNSIVGATVGAKMLTNAVRGLYTKEMNFLKVNR